MLALHDFILFLGAALILNITPGVDMLYVMTQSAARGRKHGVIAAFGISTGIVVQVLLAVIGLAALLAASKHAFFIVKLLGAAYLVYLGIKLMLPQKTANPAATVNQGQQRALAKPTGKAYWYVC